MKTTTLTGKDIKAFRNALGLKQRECAELIGVGVRQWQKYEQGYPCKELYLDFISLHCGVKSTSWTHR